MTALVSLDEPTSVSRSSVGGLARSWWARGLGAHLALLLIVLVALVPLMRIDTSFTSDDGAYGLQVKALEQGGWALLPLSAGIDPELRFPPWDGVLVDDGIVPYDRHPAHPLVLQAASRLAGGINGALLVTGIGGVLLAAAGAWYLGREIRPGSQRLAFWLAGLSPLALHAYVLWAHALAAAAAVWAAVFLLRAIRRRSAGAWALCAASLVAGLLLRSESLLLAAGFVVAAGAAGVLWRRVDVFVGASAVALAVATAVLLERSVISGIAGAAGQAFSVRGGGAGVGDLGLVGGRIEGFRRSLIEGGLFSSRSTAIAQLATVLLVAAAVVHARRGSRPIVWGCLLGGVALFVIRVVAYEGDPIPGLLVAWPVAIAGLVGAWTSARDGDGGTRVVLAGSALAGLAVLATQYADAGGGWGGRFFTMLVPILAVTAAASWSPTWRIDRRAWSCGLLAVGVLAAASSLHYVRARRDAYRDVSAIVAAQQADVAVTVIPFLPRSLWRDEQAWMLASGTELDDALDLARDADVDEVVVAVPEGWTVSVDGWDVEALGVVAPTNLSIALYRLTPV
jgi:hypothetical protein